jgi:uncharacterized lipoprotein NlpE involved in copper resistance
MRSMCPVTATLLCLTLLGCGDKSTDDTAPTGGESDTDTDTDADTDTDTDTDTDAVPVVVITGSISLAPGESIELSATTVNGEDGAYTWTSSDEAVVTVDAAGMVTGIHDGAATVTATGDSTGASGTIGLYVATTPPHYAEWLGSGHPPPARAATARTATSTTSARTARRSAASTGTTRRPRSSTARPATTRPPRTSTT